MKLYLAGKQSVARTIAMALSSKQENATRAEGYFQTPSGDCVTWTGGHLLEWADPEAYRPEYHRWQMEDLPIIPQHGKWLESPVDDKGASHRNNSRQLDVIRRLLGEAAEVIHAGDPDREGQWIIDALLQHLENTRPVKRLLIDDLNITAVRSALTSLQDNAHFLSLSESAKARSRMDWLYGINMTRALTLLGRQSGYEGVLSVGRVQTPMLAMIVKRDEAVEGFKPQIYFEMQVKISNRETGAFCRASRSNPAPDQHPDAVFRRREPCEALAYKIQGKQGVVLSHREKIIAEPPPLPFDLSALQVECENAWGYSAKEVMDWSWQLYEKHHVISYPRSDCRYIPSSFFDKSSELLDVLSSNVKQDAALAEKIKQSDCWIRQRCWDDARTSTHHAIIPVLKSIDIASLTEAEQNIYTAIATRYVAQFYPDHSRTEHEVTVDIEGERFCIRSEQIAPGSWQVGQVISCDYVDIKERSSRPPDRFTTASLIEAMDNLGTQASRALVIDGLLQRGYIIKGNKSIFSTPTGRDLVRALSLAAPHDDPVRMLEHWEKNLAAIETGALSYESVMQEFQNQLIEWIQNLRHKRTIQVASADRVLGLPSAEKFFCPTCQAVLVMRRGKHGAFWGCSRYPECKHTLPDRTDKNGNHHPLFPH